MKRLIAALSRSPICRRNIIAGLAGLMLGSFSGYTLILWSNRNAPVIVHDEREVDGAASSSGHLDIYIELDRLRDCPAETSRWLWTWVEHEGRRVKLYVPLVNSTTNITDAGLDQRFILSMPLPPGIWPGDWYYWAKTTEHCSLLPSLFRSPIRESANIPVRIIPDTPANEAAITSKE